MPAGERKSRVAVIEAGQFRPRPVAVAHGAILRHTAGTRPRHAGRKLTFVDIPMAFGTIQIVEPVSWDRRCSRIGCVTFHTHDGPVRTGQCKSRGLMFGESKRGRCKTPHRVAGLALTGARRQAELPRMFVHMACSATGVGNLVDNGRGPGCMALIAAHPGMLSFQRIASCAVFGRVESRRLESLHLVTGGALSAVGAAGELVFMRTLPMAVAAQVMGYGQLEIALYVARLAGQAGVFAGKREPASGMVEHRRCRGGFPGGQGVAGLAGRLKCPAVRITVAGRAIRECQVTKLDVRLTVGSRHLRVALAAFGLFMRTGESEASLGVIVL